MLETMEWNKIKTYIFCLKTYIVWVIVWLCCYTPTYAKVDRLSVEGSSLVNEQGDKVVLRGVSMGWHNWWPRFYNASVVKMLKEDWHCNLIRAAMGVEPEGAYLSDRQKALDCVTTVADAAIANDMYVIIDWHSHGLHTEEAKAFFKNMATRYKDIPNVIYEIFNEPINDSWDEIKEYAEQIIDCIRDVDSQALILVGTPHWDQDIHLAADNPISNAYNVMYTLHFYAATHKAWLRKRADYALKKGLPIFVSECAGMEADGDGKIDLQEWNLWRAWMDEHAISWVAWSIADKDETCSMLYPSAPDTVWTDKDVKEWGHIVKRALRAQ